MAAALLASGAALGAATSAGGSSAWNDVKNQFFFLSVTDSNGKVI